MTGVPYLSAFMGFALKGIVLLAVGCGWALLARRSSAANRHWIWSLTLGCALVLPGLSYCLPAINLSILPGAWFLTEVTEPPLDAGLHRPAILPEGRQGFASQSDQLAPRLHASAGGTGRSALGRLRTAGQAAVFLWAGVAAIFAIRLLADEWRIRRLLRGRLPLLDPERTEWAQTLALQTGVVAPVRLGVSQALSAPVAWGVWRPVILLPAGAENWSRDRWDAVLRHELAHIKRFDHLWNLMGFLSLGLHWFNPLAWYAYRQLSLERERAADDRVVRSGVQGHDYANHLLAAVRDLPMLPLVPRYTNAMATRADLTVRLQSLLDERVPRGALSRRRALVAISVAAVLLGALGSLHLGCSGVRVPEVSRAPSDDPLLLPLNPEQLRLGALDRRGSSLIPPLKPAGWELPPLPQLPALKPERWEPWLLVRTKPQGPESAE